MKACSRRRRVAHEPSRHKLTGRFAPTPVQRTYKWSALSKKTPVHVSPNTLTHQATHLRSIYVPPHVNSSSCAPAVDFNGRAVAVQRPPSFSAFTRSGMVGPDFRQSRACFCRTQILPASGTASSSRTSSMGSFTTCWITSRASTPRRSSIILCRPKVSANFRLRGGRCLLITRACCCLLKSRACCCLLISPACCFQLLQWFSKVVDN